MKFWPDSATATWTAVTAFVTLAAAIAAAIYAYLTWKLLYQQQRPLVRIIRAKKPPLLILKNIGNGPALNACLMDATGRLLGFVDAVQPLGSGTGPEYKRTGRAFLTPAVPLSATESSKYTLYYQDIDGRWHATRIVVDGYGFKTEFRRVRSVPVAVSNRASL